MRGLFLTSIPHRASAISPGSTLWDFHEPRIEVAARSSHHTGCYSNPINFNIWFWLPKNVTITVCVPPHFWVWAVCSVVGEFLVSTLDHISAHGIEIGNCWTSLGSCQATRRTWLAMSLRSHAVRSTCPLSTWQHRVRPEPPNPAEAHSSRWACATSCQLFSGEASKPYWRTPKHNGIYIAIVNKSGRKDLRHKSKRKWLAGQTWVPSSDYRSDLSASFWNNKPWPSPSAAPCYSNFVPQRSFLSWDFPSHMLSLPLHFNRLFSSASCASLLACVSPPDGSIMPELPVNVFLITCFYWKPQFPVLPLRLWVRARLGSDQRPQSWTPALPTAQEYYYHASPSLWQTTVALGMAQTRLSDLCVWQALHSNR